MSENKTSKKHKSVGTSAQLSHRLQAAQRKNVRTVAMLRARACAVRELRKEVVRLRRQLRRFEEYADELIPFVEQLVTNNIHVSEGQVAPPARARTSTKPTRWETAAEVLSAPAAVRENLKTGFTG